MAISDPVIIAAGTQAGPNPGQATYGPDGPLLGIVYAEPDGATASVQWENGKQATVPRTLLRKVFESSADAQDLVGVWAQLKSYPSADDQGFPKSPAAGGMVHRVFSTGAYDAADPDQGSFAVVSVLDGKARIMTVVPSENFPNTPNTVLEQARKLVSQ